MVKLFLSCLKNIQGVKSEKNNRIISWIDRRIIKIYKYSINNIWNLGLLSYWVKEDINFSNSK